MGNDKKDVLLEGHEADGIREYDNALPRWWLYGFYFTIVFAAAYLFYYHAWDGKDWNVLGFNARGSEKEFAAEMAHAPKKPGAVDFTAMAARTDAGTLRVGETIFQTKNLCFTCHRADLGGVVGPNLTDRYWLHGGRFTDILRSITTGYPDKGMLPFGNGNRLTNDELVAVASYVVSRQGSNPPNPKPIDPARDIELKPE